MPEARWKPSVVVSFSIFQYKLILDEFPTREFRPPKTPASPFEVYWTSIPTSHHWVKACQAERRFRLLLQKMKLVFRGHPITAFDPSNNYDRESQKIQTKTKDSQEASIKCICTSYFLLLLPLYPCVNSSAQ